MSTGAALGFGGVMKLLGKIRDLEKENASLRKEVERLNGLVKETEHLALAYYEERRRPKTVSVAKNGIVG
jgi:hypothetical protein